jgi:phenylacetate-CoA ligase
MGLSMSRPAAMLQSILRPGRVRLYHAYMATQYEPLDIRRSRQDRMLTEFLTYAEERVPHYRRLFTEAGIHAQDIRGVRDLVALPVLTKSLIREDPESLYPGTRDGTPFRQGSTGGSTGQPLRYRMSNQDYDAGVALLMRAWGCGGYRRGDSIAIVAGGSLMSSSPAMITRLTDRLTNTRHLSSYGMTQEKMVTYLEFISRWRPLYVRGYASSLFILSQFGLDRGIRTSSSVRAVFSTAECLSPAARQVIERMFNCEVYDTYGLNDGGVSAGECALHSGLHVDLERAVLEVVDEAGQPVIGRPGRILATSLLNRAMPFIRYDTGDIGVMTSLTCSCGRTAPLMSTILGRQTDLLVIDGVTIGSPVLTVLMGKTSATWYQIVQTDRSSVTFRIVNPEVGTRPADEAMIVTSMREHVGATARITFEYLEIPDDASAGDKHRIVLNRWLPPEQSARGTAAD